MKNDKYTITENNLHIEDSYKVRKKEIRSKLIEILVEDIRNHDPDCSNVWNRSDFSLQMEWAVHNALYALGLWRSHTKDVDLNADCKIEWLYKIVGCLVWVFIK